MWTSFWETLKTFVSYGERLAWLEKRIEKQEREQDATNDQLAAAVIKLELLAEREKWREEKFQHAVEMERAKLALEHSELEKERLRLELERERERRQLPPASATSPTGNSQP